MSPLLQELKQLPVSERICLVEELSDQIAQETTLPPLPESQKAQLDRRYQEFLRNPHERSSWADVKKRLLGE